MGEIKPGAERDGGATKGCVHLLHRNLSLTSSDETITPWAMQGILWSRWSSGTKRSCKKEGNKLNVTCSKPKMLVTTFSVRTANWCGGAAWRLWGVHHLSFLGAVCTMPSVNTLEELKLLSERAEHLGWVEVDLFQQWGHFFWKGWVHPFWAVAFSSCSPRVGCRCQ